MALVRICDRCNKIMKNNDKYFSAEFKSYAVDDNEPHHWYSTLSYDLCPECVENTINYFNGEFTKTNEHVCD